MTLHKPETLNKTNIIKIGNVEVNSNVMLAPMAGITDFVLRQLIRRYSKNCLLTTEMISSEALMQRQGGEILEYKENEYPLAFQISGHKPLMIAKAAKMLEKRATIIDINMGCPVNKVVKGGDGSALMRTPELAADIVKAVKDTVDLPVTVKFRLGYTAETKNFEEFALLMQDAGADAMTVHCRTRSQMYAGKADWKEISRLKDFIKVPVFANGDVIDVESARRCLEESNADGVAVARGVLGNPELLSQIEQYFLTGEKSEPLPFKAKIQMMREHLDDEIALRGEQNAIPFTRKFYPYYIKGIKGASQFRYALVTETDYDKIMNLLDEIENQYG